LAPGFDIIKYQPIAKPIALCVILKGHFMHNQKWLFIFFSTGMAAFWALIFILAGVLAFYLFRNWMKKQQQLDLKNI